MNASSDGAAELPLIIKTDVAGSIDAIEHELGKLSHERAALRIIASGVGNVSENDVNVARASGAVIIAFNTGVDAIARDLAERDSIAIESFSIIYELSEKVAELLAARAPKVAVEEELGRAKVLKTFSSGAKKQVLGVRLLSGVFSLGERAKIVRRDEEVARGKIENLQQARANVKEIRTEGEFGMEIEAKVDAAPGDEIIVFRIVES
jgi:translation initiation factor IF-2